MRSITLSACTATPFGNYLKGLAVLRLIALQSDPNARGWWTRDHLILESKLDEEGLLEFFMNVYAPTPIVAPWNGGSGFYPKDKKEGIEAIAASEDDRFQAYRTAIETCLDFPEVKQGKTNDEDARRTAILRRCRNHLADSAVEWLDAAVGIAADGTRSFAPILGTGGNEGRLDYTNNFMIRLATLFLRPPKKLPVRELLANALFGLRTTALQSGAAGQFDPGRAGGANQGAGVFDESPTNPWDLVLTMEGAVAWASGLHRRQGVSYRAILCSPFTVRSSAVGYGSASSKDDARAEIWTPLWSKPVRYSELQMLLREGRASVGGRPATNALEFAEAACSLGVDRGITHFIRYGLLKRRGDSYVALPAGKFPVDYKSESDLVREFQAYWGTLEKSLTAGAADLIRSVESAIFQLLLKPGSDRVRGLMAALGRTLRHMLRTTGNRIPTRALLPSNRWLIACGFYESPEVRVAAALASVYSVDIGSIADNLSRADRRYAWTGTNLPERLISVLSRRLQLAAAQEAKFNPLGGACVIHPGDVTLFIEGGVDDALIEDLLFAFLAVHWQGFKVDSYRSVELLPTYAILKHLFLPDAIRRAGREPQRIIADTRVLSLLRSNQVGAATAIAVQRLRSAGLRPLNVAYEGGFDARRLAAALLIPAWSGEILASGLFHQTEVPTER
jgi:CRISPR-associated protein Csx17